MSAPLSHDQRQRILTLARWAFVVLLAVMLAATMLVAIAQGEGDSPGQLQTMQALLAARLGLPATVALSLAGRSLAPWGWVAGVLGWLGIWLVVQVVANDVVGGYADGDSVVLGPLAVSYVAHAWRAVGLALLDTGAVLAGVAGLAGRASARPWV